MTNYGGSYVCGIEEMYARQPVIQQQVSLHGQQCPETFGQRSNYLTAGNPGFLYRSRFFLESRFIMYRWIEKNKQN